MEMAPIEDLDFLANYAGMPEAFGVDSELYDVDMSYYYQEPRNVAFSSDVGGMLFAYMGDATYDVHFLFLPGISGSRIKTTATAMLEEMFTQRGAAVIKGCPPRENRAVRIMGVALGFKKIANSDFVDPLGRICDIYEKRR